ISAVAISSDIYEALVHQSEKIGAFAHGYTYSAHPVCAAVALETLKIYEERDTVGHVRRIMSGFQEGLGRFAGHHLVGEVRGVGLLAGLELVKDKKSREPFDAKQGIGATFMAHARQHGLMVRAIGDTIVLSPPLIITESEVSDLLVRFEK